jgi:hypothetical protein
MIIYEIYNKYNTELLNTIKDPDPYHLTKMGDYLLVVGPAVDPATEKKGEKTFPPISADGERSWEVIAKTQEEQDEYQALQEAIALRQANEALLEYYQEQSEDLAFWLNKTDQEVTDLIAATPNTFAGFRANDLKIALGLSHVIKILKLQKDTGGIF